ncbi:hypothetical protein Pan241w_58470 [Gimesia alba]|uniref:Uncharacterized protein n=1 Tax=Gimesia alba TaxID=2527973 RepID=A0A517RPC5_9PLAN|nr:hypothetical protein Pan241w_58470 [Gimesia alba]
MRDKRGVHSLSEPTNTENLNFEAQTGPNDSPQIYEISRICDWKKGGKVFTIPASP